MRLLLSPLKLEIQCLLKHFDSQGVAIEEFNDQGRKYWKLPSKDLVCVVGGHGKAQFGVQTQFWISHLNNVSHVFGVGAGGALNPKVQPLDVVIATEVLEYDYKIRFDPESKPPRHKCDLRNIEKLKNQSFDSFTLHIGALACGDEDIVDAERAENLYQQTQALAVAWEGAGGARAAKYNNISYTEIRAMTDNGRKNVPINFHDNLNKALAHAGQVLNKIL